MNKTAASFVHIAPYDNISDIVGTVLVSVHQYIIPSFSNSGISNMHQ